MLEAKLHDTKNPLICGDPECSAILTARPGKDCKSLGGPTAPGGCEASCVCPQCNQKNCCDRSKQELVLRKKRQSFESELGNG